MKVHLSSISVIDLEKEVAVRVVHLQRSTYMINLLMCQSSIILQDIVVLRTTCSGNLLRYSLHCPDVSPHCVCRACDARCAYEDFGELVIRDVGDFRAMVFRNNELVI